MNQDKKNQKVVQPGKKVETPERGDKKKHISSGSRTTRSESDLTSRDSSHRDNQRKNERNERHDNERSSR